MPAPYPPVPFQLETALLVTLRDTLRWESALAPLNSSGTYSGTLTVVDTEHSIFDPLAYQRRDRELGWLDTRNAAAVVEVSLECADVWNASALRPKMEGPQIGHIDYSAQDTSATGLLSKVVHVKYASLPIDAISTDRDLTGRDILIYETLNNAIRNLFVDPPIVTSGTNIVPVTSWSYANGTYGPADINTALPLGRDLFRNQDMHLADRDNQMAGYVAQLCQVLKNPFSFATRLYVAVFGLDGREVETYTFAEQPFQPGHVYIEGDEIYFQGTIYRVKPGVGTTSDVPWTSPWAWMVVTTPRKRIWTVEPNLPGRNRFVYDTETFTLQWFRESSDVQHVPQLFALSIPGIFSGQTIQTIAQIPQAKDGQFWRGKAAHVVPSGGTVTDLYAIPSTASFVAQNFTIQETGASLTIPSTGSIWFPDPAILSHPQNVPPGNYRVTALVEPNSTVELPGNQNNQGVSGTLGGATYTGFEKLTWQLGLPPTQWTVEFDYTNLSGSTDGFRIFCDMGGATVFNDTSPFYFTDANGNPLPNGTLVTTPAFPVIPTGDAQVFGLNWTGGAGQLHIRSIRFKSTTATGRYKISGTFAGSVAMVDVIGTNQVPGVMTWDFSAKVTTPDDFIMHWEEAAQLPIRFLRFDLASLGTNSPTPNAQGFQAYRHDCLVRASKSAQQAFSESFFAGTSAPTFLSAGSVWDGFSTERWMAVIEQAEPRLRELDNIPSGGIVTGRQYQVSTGSLIYEGNGYAAGQTFVGDTQAVYVWAAAGTLNQVGAWQRSRSTHLGRPALVPDGMFFDYSFGTVGMALGPERNAPVLAALQPWMMEVGLYVAQPEFWLPQSL